MDRTPRSRSASELLRTYDYNALLQMARERGTDLRGKSKDALVKLLAPRLYSPEAINSALANLEPVERALLDSLILAGGEAVTSVIRDQLLAEDRIDRPARSGWGFTQGESGGSPTARESRKLVDIVARLGALGLVFCANAGQNTKTRVLGTLGQYLFVPDAILEHLPPVALPVQTVEAPCSEQAADPDAFMRDMYLLLSFAQKQPIPLTVKGQIPKRTLVQIDESLRLQEGAASVKSEAELGRLPLLRAVAKELGVLTPGAQGLELRETPLPFLSLPRGERQRKLYEAYRETTGWSELARLSRVSITPRDRLNAPGIVAARKQVLREIAELPPGEWIPLRYLLDRMRKRAFEFLLPRDWSASNYAYYGYTPDPYGGINHLQLSFVRAREDDKEPSWETVEAEVIRVMVTEPLSWLGLVDLGWQQEEIRGVTREGVPASIFRITEVGSTLLHGGTPTSAVQNPHVVIQPNFQIFAFEPTGEDVLFTLDRIAQRVRVEQVVEYHLTRESVYAAQRQGMEMADILGFLERVSSVPIPQNVHRTLEEWGAQLERIVVRRNVSLLQGIDEQTLDALYADPELSRLLGRRIAPTAALVPANQLQAVYSLLLNWTGKSGRILPALSEGDDGLDSRAVAVHVDGHITFQQQLPSIYLRAALRPFAGEEGDQSLRLTPKSLQRAAAAQNGKGESYSAGQILDRLARVSVDPLTDDVTTMVRRWAKDWGEGALADVTLLRVENEATMKDLQADDEIGRYLQSIPGAPMLAAIRPDQADKVRGILLERGMELGDQIISTPKR